MARLVEASMAAEDMGELMGIKVIEVAMLIKVIEVVVVMEGFLMKTDVMGIALNKVEEME